MRWLSLSILIAVGWLLSGSAVATTVEGVKLPDQVNVGGQQLVLNGAGVREKFFFDIYVAALYLPEKNGDADAILAADRPWRMMMHFLYSKVAKKKLDAGWEEGISDNVSPEQLGQLKQRLEQFKSLFEEMHKGEEAILDYVPGKGVQVSVKGEMKGTVTGSDFAAALLSVWLGKEPVTGKLKKALLGVN